MRFCMYVRTYVRSAMQLDPLKGSTKTPQKSGPAKPKQFREIELQLACITHTVASD